MDKPVAAETIAEDQRRAEMKEKRRRLFKLFGIGLAVVAALYLIWYVLIGSRHVSTDNAYVGGDVAIVTPLTTGTVAEVLVSDTQMVKKGQILVRLLNGDATAILNRAQAEYARAQRDFRRTLAEGEGLRATVAVRAEDIQNMRSQLQAAQAAFDKAKLDYDRRQALAKSGAVSADELTAATSALASAKAALAVAAAQVKQAEANRRVADESLNANLALTQGTTVDTSPDVAAARARLDQARLEMGRTVIRAQLDGIVTKRTVQVGQHVDPGAPLMTIVPVNQLYVDANFKENQLAKVRIGQKVELTSLLYGNDVVFHGRVAGLSGGTGAAFALIPAQNATGNWIRITQRLPVRIALDPAELQAHPLRMGLSMEADIDVGD